VTVEGAGARTDPPRLLARFPVERPPTVTAQAAVTIVLRSGLADVEALLIERATNPQDPASGEVGLPGGHVADDDDSLAATAARELREEVGLALSDLTGPLRYVGTQPAPRFGISVGVFAAELSDAAAPHITPEPAEVAHVFWLPRSALDRTVRVHRSTSRGEIEVPAAVHEGHVLWGFTWKVVRQFFGLPAQDAAGGPYFAPHRDPERPESPPS
jgi:8-oxo-dGTP pyrophosphatase MutT (NUDIX family)